MVTFWSRFWPCWTWPGNMARQRLGMFTRDHKRGQPVGHVWTRPVLTRSCSGHVEVTFGPCCSPAPDVTIVASNVAWNIICGAVRLQRGQGAGQVQTWPLHNCTKKCEKLWFQKKKGKPVLCETPELKIFENKTRVYLYHLYCYTHSILKPLTQFHSKPFDWYQFVSRYGGGLQKAAMVRR